jgi:hypothetical protein
MSMLAMRALYGTAPGGAHARARRVLDSRPMEITLRAPGTPIDALTLEAGLHALGRAPEGGLRRVDGAHDARVWIRVDRCGTWLSVVDGVRGVHVNGRPVRRCALLRAGDSVHVDGWEVVLTAPVAAVPGAGGSPSAASAAAPAMPGGEAADPRLVLRGVGGRHHGRSFTLAHARTVGSAADADICVEGACRDGSEPGAPHRARIAWEGGQVVLRASGDGVAVAVNGVPAREAVLRPGDQLAFETGQRFVVEAPMAVPDATDGDAAGDAGETSAAAAPALRPTARRLPLLLFAALLLAAALSALLLL